MIAAAIQLVPKNIPREHHGRTVAGIDCVGLIFLTYRLAGRSIDHLDMPYGHLGERASNPAMLNLLHRAVSSGEFREIDRAQCGEDGDIVLFRCQMVMSSGSMVHAGIVVDQRVYHMTDRLLRLSLRRFRPYVTSCLRHV